MHEIIGKWVQSAGQPYAGLWFEFDANGTFSAEYEEMAIVSGGTYSISGNEIDMDQTTHTLGMTGKFAGLFEINGNILKLALAGGAGHARPTDLTDARIYIKVQDDGKE